MLRNPFLRQLLAMLGGVGSVQLLGVLAAPLLTRLYAPADFGALGVYMACLTLSTAVVAGRYELAVPLPEQDEESANVLAVALGWVVAITCLTAFVSFAGGEAGLRLLQLQSYPALLWWLPVGVGLTGAYTVLSYWSIRRAHYGRLATTKATQGVAMVGVQLGGAAWGGTALLAAQAVGQSLGLWRLASTAVADGVMGHWRWARLRQVAWQYRRFPLVSAPGAVLNLAAIGAVPLVISATFLASVAGQFVLATRILSLPANLIGGAISQVFLSHAVDRHRDGRLAGLVDELQTALVSLVLPLLLLMLILGPWAFAWVFGEAWRESGRYAQLISPWLAAQFVAAPLSHTFTVLAQESRFLVWQGCQFVLFAAALGWGWLTREIDGLVSAVSVAGVVCYLGLFLATRWSVGLPVVPQQAVLGRRGLALAGIFLPVWGAVQWGGTALQGVILVAGMVGLAGYYLQVGRSLRVLGRRA